MREVKCGVCGYDVPTAYMRCPRCRHIMANDGYYANTAKSFGIGKILFIACLFVLGVVLICRYSAIHPADNIYSCLFSDTYKPVLSHHAYDIDVVENNVRYLLSTGRVKLSGLSGCSSVHEYCDIYMDAVEKYPEFCYDSVYCSSYNGIMTVELRSVFGDKDRKEYVDSSVKIGKQVRSELYSSGALTSSMSEVERAWVFYDWVIANCDPDWDANENIKPGSAMSEIASEYRLSCTAYGAFINKKAVNSGYVAAYNLLLRLDGIDCAAVRGSDSIWTEAILDGEAFVIDVTYADVYGSYDEYFCMTPEYAEKVRPHVNSSGSYS